MNVVVTGGRNFGCVGPQLAGSVTVRDALDAHDADVAARDLLYSTLDEIHDDTPITLIRNGGMTGADALSSRWAYERRIDTECIGALWGKYGPKAGPIRNESLLSRPTGLVVAFPGGRGTAHTVERARRMHIRVIEVTA